MNKIRERFDAFVKEHGCEPRYAECEVIFEDDFMVVADSVSFTNNLY